MLEKLHPTQRNALHFLESANKFWSRCRYLARKSPFFLAKFCTMHNVVTAKTTHTHTHTDVFATHPQKSRNKIKRRRMKTTRDDHRESKVHVKYQSALLCRHRCGWRFLFTFFFFGIFIYHWFLWRFSGMNSIKGCVFHQQWKSSSSLPLNLYKCANLLKKIGWVIERFAPLRSSPLTDELIKSLLLITYADLNVCRRLRFQSQTARPLANRHPPPQTDEPQLSASLFTCSVYYVVFVTTRY